MIRRKLMSVLKRNPRFTVKVAPNLMAIILWGVSGLLLMATDASARRRYYHERYAPPASAMAIDLHTGRILYSKNANEPRYPASLTKVMTLYLLFDALRDGKITMNTELRVSAHAAAQSPTKLDLSEGDTISVADAIGAIVTKSANDMAVTVAEALAGSEEEFARRMTQKARTIGMLNTTFRNASGLPNPDQRTSAQDLIILGKSILADHPERSKVFSTKYFQYDGEVYRNHNTLLFSYQGMEGMKTGFTSASGFNLIATARRGDKRLLAVVLGGSSSSSRNAAMRNILDNSWSKALTQVAARKAGISVAALKPKADEPEPVEKPTRQETLPTRPASPVVLTSNMSGPLSQLKRKPDRASISMLLASIEAGIIKPQSPASVQPAAVASDMTTDEPEDNAERAATRSASYVPPAPQDIARNETLVEQAAPAQSSNVSVHYKTVRLPEVVPLAAAALDGMPETQPVKPAQIVRAVQKEEEEQPQTLAAATAATSHEMDQPGPFHVQVGAFPDQAQAEQRLQSVKEALGSAVIKAHPEFIMPVSLPKGVTMFRARLSRFADEAQAKSACRKLKRSGIECWDIRAQ
jgi:D-alanyl-D-alanine carboxypeptidase